MSGRNTVIENASNGQMLFLERCWLVGLLVLHPAIYYGLLKLECRSWNVADWTRVIPRLQSVNGTPFINAKCLSGARAQHYCCVQQTKRHSPFFYRLNGNGNFSVMPIVPPPVPPPISFIFSLSLYMFPLFSPILPSSPTPPSSSFSYSSSLSSFSSLSSSSSSLYSSLSLSSILLPSSSSSSSSLSSSSYRMAAPECLPLILEPESRFYTDPVLVLDFQSLYPSIVIAHNYCYTTCVGRVHSLAQ